MRTKIICGDCGTTHTRFCTMNIHMRLVHGGWIKCEKCEISFATLTRYKQHMINIHHYPNTIVVSIRCSCDGCDFMSDNIRDDYNHVRYFHGARKFTVCQKKCK